METITQVFNVDLTGGNVNVRELAGGAILGVMRFVTDGDLVMQYPSGATVTITDVAGQERRYWPELVLQAGTTATVQACC